MDVSLFKDLLNLREHKCLFSKNLRHLKAVFRIFPGISFVVFLHIAGFIIPSIVADKNPTPVFGEGFSVEVPNVLVVKARQRFTKSIMLL